MDDAKGYPQQPSQQANQCSLSAASATHASPRPRFVTLVETRLSRWQAFPLQINESVTEPCLVAAGHRSLTPRVRPGWWLTVLLGLPTVAVGLALLPGDRRRPVDISSLVVSQLSLSTGSCPRADRRRPRPSAEMPRQLDRLTDRGRQVLVLVAQSRSNAEIADLLCDR